MDKETQLYLQVTSTSFYFYDAGEDGKWRRNIKTKKDWKLSKQRSKYEIECFSQHSRKQATSLMYYDNIVGPRSEGNMNVCDTCPR